MVTIMTISEFVENKLKHVFLANTPAVSSESKIYKSWKDEHLNYDTVRELHDLISVYCWILAKDGHMYIRMDSLLNNYSRQAKIHMTEENTTYTHRHSYTELAYVAMGRLCQEIDGKEEIFNEGEFCLIDRNSLHKDTLLLDDSIIIFLNIADSFFNKPAVSKKHTNASIDTFFRKLIVERKQKYKYISFVPKPGFNSEAPELLMHLLNEIWNYRAGTSLLIQGYVERLLAVLPIQYQFNLAPQDEANMRKLLFNELTDYLNENYASAGIEQLKIKFNYNNDYFNRLIKQFTGMTYSKYLQTIRLSKAMEFIMNSEDSVECIAGQVGYTNTGYFYKIFMEKFNNTPGSFR